MRSAGEVMGDRTGAIKPGPVDAARESLHLIEGRRPMIRTALSAALAMLAFSGTTLAQCHEKGDAGRCAASNDGGATVIRAAHEQGDKDIVETAMAAGKFNTLAAALKAAGWVEPLKAKGPFTVFAPTDEAFAKLPQGTIEMLLKPENKDK